LPSRTLSLTLATLCALQSVNSPASAAESTVVVMLFDGFAPPYIRDFDTPNFESMQREGAWSHQMDAAFPSISRA
jgi:hypothetical protein